MLCLVNVYVFWLVSGPVQLRAGDQRVFNSQKQKFAFQGKWDILPSKLSRHNRKAVREAKPWIVPWAKIESWLELAEVSMAGRQSKHLHAS